MLTNSDINKLQEMEDYCIFVATTLATGKNEHRFNLSQEISNMHFATRSRLYKPQVTNLIHDQEHIL